MFKKVLTGANCIFLAFLVAACPDRNGHKIDIKKVGPAKPTPTQSEQELGKFGPLAAASPACLRLDSYLERFKADSDTLATVYVNNREIGQLDAKGKFTSFDEPCLRFSNLIEKQPDVLVESHYANDIYSSTLVGDLLSLNSPQPDDCKGSIVFNRTAGDSTPGESFAIRGIEHTPKGKPLGKPNRLELINSSATTRRVYQVVNDGNRLIITTFQITGTKAAPMVLKTLYFVDSGSPETPLSINNQFAGLLKKSLKVVPKQFGDQVVGAPAKGSAAIAELKPVLSSADFLRTMALEIKEKQFQPPTDCSAKN